MGFNSGFKGLINVLYVNKQEFSASSWRSNQGETIHRTTQKLGRVRAVPRLCVFYPGICLTTEEKAWKTLSQGSHT